MIYLFLGDVKCLSVANRIVVFYSRSIYGCAEFNVEKQEWSVADVPTKEEEQLQQFNCNCIKSPMYKL